MKVVIIGGGPAGTKTAVELRKQDKELGIAILEKSSHRAYSRCALPYTISKEINDKDIFSFDAQYYTDNKIQLILGAEVTSVDRQTKKVFYTHDKQKKSLSFDKLVMAIGSSACVAPIPGLQNTQFLTFKSLEDAKEVSQNIGKNKKAVIIGAGVMGVELAYSLSVRGMKVSLVEVLDRVLANWLDPDMSQQVHEYLTQQGIQVLTGAKVTNMTKSQVVLEEASLDYDLLVLCCGVRANTDLAEDAGLAVDKGIIVDELMKTNDENIYACGDCTESFYLITGKPIMSQLGTTAVRQAKVVAENILGQKQKFPPVLSTCISRVGKLVIAATGISQEMARKSSLETVSASYTGLSKEHYPGGTEITLKLVSNTKGRLVGAQLIGQEEIVGRINALSLAIQKNATVSDLAKAETGYNPCVTPIFDPITIAAEICLKKLKNGPSA